MTGEPKRGGRSLPQVITGLLIWVVVAGLIGFTGGLPYMDEGAPGPRFMPILLAVFLGVLNIIFWTQAFLSRGNQQITFPRVSQLIRPFGFFLVGVLMVFLWERLGVVVTVLIASFFELKVIEEYSWMRSFWVGLLFSLSTWILFQVLLGVPLPAGPFEWLSFL
jgi:hypothetical protein